MELYYAHAKRDETGEKAIRQTVSSHCRGAAAAAAQALLPAGLSECGYLAALLHDAGKYTQRFQEYLLHEIGARGSVNHSFAGVRLLLEAFHTEDRGEYADVVSELLAFAAGAHHGLFDVVDEQGKSGFVRRMTAPDIAYEEARGHFFACCAPPGELARRFEAARAELAPVLDRIREMPGEDASDDCYEEEVAFYVGMLARLLLSAVIDGDRRDTAAFEAGIVFPPRRGERELCALWDGCLAKVEAHLASFGCDSDIKQARAALSQQCRDAAERPGGVYRLTVPTGGGKTLSSLRYALAHARAHGKQRLLFVSPLLSILDQNAGAIRDALGSDELILEHHSDFVQPEEAAKETLDKRELLLETWDSPVIITTLVQFLQTLFSGRTGSIRRMCALCGSVIVIDEVQTVPSKMLSLFTLAVNFLAEVCGATVILCSATQPCIERTAHSLCRTPPELVPYDAALWQVFRRTDLHDLGERSPEQIAAFALERMQTAHSLLIVCNKRAEAETLYQLLKGTGHSLFFLSAALCPAHRKKVLDALQAELERSPQSGAPGTICLSTQVIEAGVDISFAEVIRLAAGMDSVIQAAGRCNRSGEAGPGSLSPVWLVQWKGETLGMLQDIQWGKDATQTLLSEAAHQPEPYPGWPFSDEAIRSYYRALYRRMPDSHQDFVLRKQGHPGTLLSLLARNEHALCDAPYYLRQSFRLAGRLFTVFDQDTVDVLAPYEDGAELIGALQDSRAMRPSAELFSLLQRAKPYTVALHRSQFEALARGGGLMPLCGGGWGLIGHYDPVTGFTPEQTELEFLGVE